MHDYTPIGIKIQPFTPLLGYFEMCLETGIDFFALDADGIENG